MINHGNFISKAWIEESSGMRERWGSLEAEGRGGVSMAQYT